MHKPRTERSGQMQRKNGQRKALEQALLRVMKLTKFDEGIFRRLIEKVKVQSMVEAVFVFKTGFA